MTSRSSARSDGSTTRRSTPPSTRSRKRCGTSRTSASRCWASRSSPAPTMSASLPRWRLLVGCSTREPRWSDTTPRRRPTPSRSCRVWRQHRTRIEALEGAHCVVICTAWEEFRSLDLETREDADGLSDPRGRTELPRSGRDAGEGLHVPRDGPVDRRGDHLTCHARS